MAGRMGRSAGQFRLSGYVVYYIFCRLPKSAITPVFSSYYPRFPQNTLPYSLRCLRTSIKTSMEREFRANFERNFEPNFAMNFDASDAASFGASLFACLSRCKGGSVCRRAVPRLRVRIPTHS